MFDVFIMDMGGHDENVSQILSKLPHAQTMRYMTSHLEMVKRAAKKSRTEFFWLIASCCDYTRFNFDHIPVPWQQKQIHCWASGSQKFGDTFLINVAAWKEQETVELLEWYKDINWHWGLVNRLDWPQVEYDSNNLIDVVKATDFKSIYVRFKPTFHTEYVHNDPCLWRQETRNIISLSSGNSYCLVPRDAKLFINTQMYDYPNIEMLKTIKDPDQDIIFISYDEVEAEQNYLVLKNRNLKVTRLQGVDGMDNALKKAAELATTNYYYAVFAKTEIVDSFNFNFKPDYFQQPKHYIFYATNASNELTYGYAGVILYNVDIVKNITEFGVDFTMSSAHAVIPEVSAVARINADPYQAWRSAFRETAKLAQFYDRSKCIETEYRLHIWRNYAKGKNSEWVIKGANDGYSFYTSNKDNPAMLKNAFDWNWLKAKFQELYQGTDLTNFD